MTKKTKQIRAYLGRDERDNVYIATGKPVGEREGHRQVFDELAVVNYLLPHGEDGTTIFDAVIGEGEVKRVTISWEEEV